MEIIGFDPFIDQSLEEFRQHLRAVIDTAHQDRLTEEEDPRMPECFPRLSGPFRYFPGMVHVIHECDGSMALQKRDELGCEAVRESRRHPRVNADPPDVWDGSDPLQDVLESRIAQQQWVPSAEDDLVDGGMVPEIGHGLVHFSAETGRRTFREENLSKTESAIEWATKGGHQQDPIGIAMHQKRGGRVTCIPDGVRYFSRVGMELPDVRDRLKSDGALRVVWVHQAQIMRTDSKFILVQHRAKCGRVLR